VGRLLKVLTEEVGLLIFINILKESFWVFSSIIENLMPLDYYSNMVGALID